MNREFPAAGRSHGPARPLLALAAVCALAVSTQSAIAQTRPRGGGEHWVATWATSAVRRSPTPPASNSTARPNPANAPPNFADKTLREIVHVSIGGNRARVVFSNAFGEAPLSIGAASIALRGDDSAIAAGSSHPLTFAGVASVTIPSGATMVSDPVAITFPARSDLAIDVYFPKEMMAAASPLTQHSGAYQTNYVSEAGNFSGSAQFPVANPINSWYFLARVDTIAPASTSGIVFFGDSITDGTRSTPNTNHRWPDLLEVRLATAKSPVDAIMNEAIAGNRLLSEAVPNFGINALARFDRDVLTLPGAAYMIVLEGINDIGMGRAGAAPSAAELIAAHQQLIERAHAHGLEVIGATLTPFEGAAYFTPDGETKREAINAWIRASKPGTSTYDGVIDFDAATRDPQNPTKFNPKYDSGDHLHPNDTGYQAMADSIDLKLFRGAAGAR